MGYLEDRYSMLPLLASLMPPSADEIGRKIADDFRKRRIEKSLTREMVARKSRVALANITRFERTGQISLRNLVLLATAMGYVSEVQNIFGTPKYSTIEELTQIRRNRGKKKAYRPRKKRTDETEKD